MSKKIRELLAQFATKGLTSTELKNLKKEAISLLDKTEAPRYDQKFAPPFRVGRKQKRAVLDANGKEVILMAKGAEHQAQLYCDYLNENLPKKTSSKIKIPPSTKSYGFCGIWKDGTPGWMGLSHIGGSRRFPDYPHRNERMIGERLFLCEITLTPVLDKNGRPITRIVK